MQFQFYSPTQLIHGPGSRGQIGPFAASLGKTVFFIHGVSLLTHNFYAAIHEKLEENGLHVIPYKKGPGEPDVAQTDAAAQAARAAGCDVVLSVGGGSGIDLGKAVAGLVTNEGSVLEYMEGVGHNRQVTQRPLPHIAVPTTAGTGAEVTKNAVITAPSIQYKKSFRSPHLFPTLAVLDAELTLPLSRQQTAYSGMDAITQLIESFITKNASPLTDALALAGLRLALPAMRRLITDLHDLEAREHLLLASTLSGITLANAGLGMAHGFAPAFGALYGVPHGMACAILLPHAMRFNQPAAEAKFAAIGALVDPAETHPPRLAQAAIAAIQEINDTLQIPRDFQEFQIPQEEKPAILERSRGNSMNGNPIPVRDDEALAFLEKIL